MTKLKLTRHFLSTIAVAFFLIIAFGSDDDKITESSTTSSTSAAATDKPQTPLELTQQLKREIAGFDKPFDGSAYSGTVESVQMELVLFSVWQAIIRKGESSNSENQKLASKLKKKVVNLQVKEFPRMRKKYADVLAKKLWENDIYVSVQGATNGIINFTAGIFAANKNIQETQNLLNKVLTEFRFKETRFRWYKEADEFTYYKLETPIDKELVTLE
jgi:hypothetical protein